MAHTHSVALAHSNAGVLVAANMRHLWKRVVVLANRAPVTITRAVDGSATAKQSASGLVTALEPLVNCCNGTWVAYGTGSASADVCAHRHHPPYALSNSRYRIRYVPVPEPEYSHYYGGFANEGLWPLCHDVHVRPRFRPSDFAAYGRVNARFAAAVCDEVRGESSLILVQDYHCALAPRLLRRTVPQSTIVAFWHIPWPRQRVFRACPWSRQLLDGLLGSDIIGFQTPEDCANFLDSVASALPAMIDRVDNVISFCGHRTRVRAYPVGVEWYNRTVQTLPPPRACRESVFRDLQLPADARLGVGVDRLDYTKGINHKFLVIERLLERHRELRGRLVFVQVAEPSRVALSAYRATGDELVATCERINARFGTDAYQPIVLVQAHQDPAAVYRLYRAADFCYVGSLCDGMNLVAKEFVCARSDEQGVLVLSQFAGAFRQLDAAVGVNPYAIGESADAVRAALMMSRAEQRRRMRCLRETVQRFDATWWTETLLRDSMTLPRLPVAAQASARFAYATSA